MNYELDLFIDGTFESKNLSDDEIEAISPVDENHFEVAWKSPCSGKIKVALARGSYVAFSKEWFKEKFKKVVL